MDLLTVQARVLLFIGLNPESRLRDVGEGLGITERSAYDIVVDLVDGGYLVKVKQGRRNRYLVQHHLPDTNPNEVDEAIGEVFGLLGVLTGYTPGPRTLPMSQRPGD